jgi:hypothetical protein
MGRCKGVSLVRAIERTPATPQNSGRAPPESHLQFERVSHAMGSLLSWDLPNLLEDHAAYLTVCQCPSHPLVLLPYRTSASLRSLPTQTMPMLLRTSGLGPFFAA